MLSCKICGMKENDSNNAAGALLKKLRQEYKGKLGLRGFATTAGVHYADINKMERGLRKISPMAFVLLSDALGLSSSDRAALKALVTKEHSVASMMEAELRVGLEMAMQSVPVEYSDVESFERVTCKAGYVDYVMKTKKGGCYRVKVDIEKE